jgi:hypothetical protein
LLKKPVMLCPRWTTLNTGATTRFVTPTSPRAHPA